MTRVSIFFVAFIIIGCEMPHQNNARSESVKTANTQADVEKWSFGEGLNSSVFSVIEDPVTGCEYISRFRVGIQPRIASDGITHMGCGDV